MSAKKCALAREIVHGLRSHWQVTPRIAGHYVLGAWEYRETEEGVRKYYDEAARLNPVLRERLGWLYELVAKELSKALAAATLYDERMGLPGFSIQLPSSGNVSALGEFHFDNPKSLCFAPLADPNQQFITYLMPLAMPRVGAGLDFWDLEFDAFERLPPARKAFEVAFGSRYHAYRLGVATIMWGYAYHRPAGTNELSSSDERLMFQGHGIKRDGVWTLYL